MRIIGLTGPAGCGKSTVASVLRSEHGFYELSFAEPIRNFIQMLTDLDDDELQARKEEPNDLLCGKTPRQAMQWLGTEYGRQLLGPDVWIRQVEQIIDDAARRIEAGNLRIVISDCRFANEGAFIRSRGELWHLTRPGTAVNPHASELGITPTDRDVTLDNDCSIPALRARIAALVGFEWP